MMEKSRKGSSRKPGRPEGTVYREATAVKTDTGLRLVGWGASRVLPSEEKESEESNRLWINTRGQLTEKSSIRLV